MSLVVDVTPHRDIHVYAPGNPSYKPVALTVKPQMWVIPHELQVPKSEPYVFKPLNETVRVFQKPFHLVRDVTIDASREAQDALKDPDVPKKQ